MKGKIKAGTGLDRGAAGAGTGGGGGNPWPSMLRVGGLAVLVGLGAALTWQRLQLRSTAGDLTFHRDIAPIVYQHCSTCHHPGQAAPFDLLGYQDVAKRTRQIVAVTSRRLMPPWLPEPGYGEFVGQRGLKEEEILRIRRWAEQGAPEGRKEDGPPPPKWREGWPLGRPDLIVKLAQPYAVPAEGRDIYRNFVIPIPVESARYVRAVEFQPDHARSIHHAFMFIDPTRDSRRRDELDAEPGFAGLHTPPSAQTPPGQFLSWQPGKLSTVRSEDFSWLLQKNCDLVLQMHLRPSGKAERVEPKIGFYFTDQPPKATPYKFGFINFALDIPAGEANYEVREDYLLPVDLDVWRVLPHAHYLGRRMESFATLPDGTRKWLLRIPNWDFNWQGDYEYAQPVFLPRGATVSMVYTYDNSTNNLRNPNQPPGRVRYGLNSADEMAELWFQVVPRGSNGLKILEQDQLPRVLTNSIAYNRYLLGLDPNNARAHAELGRVLTFLTRYQEALPHLQKALQLQPDADEAHYALGLFYRMQNQIEAARAEFQAAVRSNPEHGKAYGNLGLLLLQAGHLAEARVQFEHALRINPEDSIARESLEQIARGGVTSPK